MHFLLYTCFKLSSSVEHRISKRLGSEKYRPSCNPAVCSEATVTHTDMRFEDEVSFEEENVKALII